jgi:MFS family permease
VFAKYFENSFFDSASKNATVFVYAIFAITFLMRPLGSVFFGRFADRHGRRASLMVSVSVMAGTSAVIGALPGRQTIGVAAPVLLIICRLVQVSRRLNHLCLTSNSQFFSYFSPHFFHTSHNLVTKSFLSPFLV